MTQPRIARLTDEDSEIEVSEAQTALLERGARNAVETCLAVQSTDRVCVITDEETQVVGDALTRASQQAGAAVDTLLLESFGQRPLTSLPDTLRSAIERVDPTCSFYAAAAKKGEISFRIQLLPWLVHTLGVRHGHMPGITPALMTEGMLADYDEVSRVTSRVADIVRPARQIQVRSAKGSDIVAQFSPDLRWVPCPGLYRRQGTWGNLPEGEVFTSPARVDGLLTVDELGDYFSEQYGVLPQPVTFRIEDSIAVEITSENAALANRASRLPRQLRKWPAGGRVRHRHQHRTDPAGRQSAPGREVSRRTRRLRKPLPRRDRRNLASQRPRRHHPDRLRHRRRRPATHARRPVPLRHVASAAPNSSFVRECALQSTSMPALPDETCRIVDRWSMAE